MKRIRRKIILRNSLSVIVKSTVLNGGCLSRDYEILIDSGLYLIGSTNGTFIREDQF